MLTPTPDAPAFCPYCPDEPARGYGNYPELCDYCADEAAYDDHIDRMIDDAQEARYERNHR